MDLRYSESDEKFRARFRRWLEQAVPEHGDPPPPHDWPARRGYDTGWQPRDLTPQGQRRLIAAERKRRRKRAQNLGHPPPAGFRMLAATEVPDTVCALVLEGRAGWGHITEEELVQADPVGDRLVCTL